MTGEQVLALAALCGLARNYIAGEIRRPSEPAQSRALEAALVIVNEMTVEAKKVDLAAQKG